MDAPLWLFVSESFDTGWRARLAPPTGLWRDVEPMISEAGFIALPIGATDTQAVLEYTPPTLWAGLIASLCGFLALLGLWKSSHMR
jgi:hypothetical protein